MTRTLSLLTSVSLLFDRSFSLSFTLFALWSPIPLVLLVPLLCFQTLNLLKKKKQTVTLVLQAAATPSPSLVFFLSLCVSLSTKRITNPPNMDVISEPLQDFLLPPLLLPSFSSIEDRPPGQAISPNQ